MASTRQITFMDEALLEAEAAAKRGEVPVGAVLVHKGLVIAKNGNRTREYQDPTAHAEMLVIRAASSELGERLTDCDLYVTLEPCAMCAAAISFARLRRLYYGARDVKMGAVESGPCFYEQKTCHHRPDIYSGLAETASIDLLHRFFQPRR